MIVIARLPDSAGQFSFCYCVTQLVDFDPEDDILTVEFAGSTHRTTIDNVRRVHVDMTDAAKSSGSQQDAVERIKTALLEHRRARTKAEQQASKKPARNRYASIGNTGDLFAPSPAKPAPVEAGSGQAPVLARHAGLTPLEAAPAPRREAKPGRGSRPTTTTPPRDTATPAGETRQAQRLSNTSLEIFFPMDTAITFKLPNGVVDVVETAKPFGKLFKK